jgi:hypothetical protein
VSFKAAESVEYLPPDPTVMAPDGTVAADTIPIWARHHTKIVKRLRESILKREWTKLFLWALGSSKLREIFALKVNPWG